MNLRITAGRGQVSIYKNRTEMITILRYVGDIQIVIASSLSDKLKIGNSATWK